MLDAVQVQDCKNKKIEESRAFARSYYTLGLNEPLTLSLLFSECVGHCDACTTDNQCTTCESAYRLVGSTDNNLIACEGTFKKFFKFWRRSVFFEGPLISLVWSSGDIRLWFQSQSGSLLVRFVTCMQCIYQIRILMAIMAVKSFRNTYLYTYLQALLGLQTKIRCHRGGYSD